MLLPSGIRNYGQARIETLIFINFYSISYYILSIS